LTDETRSGEMKKRLEWK